MFKYFILFLILNLMWLIIQLAAVPDKILEAKKKGTKPGGVSIMPGIPMFPLVFCVVAWGINLIKTDIGFWIVGILHGILVVVAIIYIVSKMIKN